MVKKYYNPAVDSYGYYCEYLEENGEWVLTFLPPEKAFICAIRLGKDQFHFLDDSMLIFGED
jgi:hypothetical protein